MTSSKEHPHHAFAPGDWVHVEGMGGVGQVVAIDGRRRKARVLVGDQEWVLAVGRLIPADPPEQPKPFHAVRVTGGSSVVHEIDLHGERVEDALEIADRAIDQAIVHHLSSLKIIHGHGTGAVRRAIREMLNHHPHVESYRFGQPQEGGLACTVVQLRSLNNK